MDIKTNAGYILTDTVTVGESNFVLGVHGTAPSQFVTWQCKDDDYFWGHYFSDRLTAVKDLCQRALDEAKYLEPAQKDIISTQNKIKSKDLER
jgi:hypothetical protein